MRFKVGDKVRVRNGLVEGNLYSGVFCNDEMAAMGGEILTIDKVEMSSMSFYEVKENSWIWADDMLELLESASENAKEDKNMNMRKVCYEIVDYKYDAETGGTYIKWADKTETTVKPEEGTEPNQYVGFVTAYAKKAAGNTGRINSFFDYWAIKKPALDAINAEKDKAAKAEAKRIAAKRKAKKEKWLLRREALRRKRAYEAAQLAQEKYGVPVDFNEEN